MFICPSGTMHMSVSQLSARCCRVSSRQPHGSILPVRLPVAARRVLPRFAAQQLQRLCRQQRQVKQAARLARTAQHAYRLGVLP